MPDAKGERWLNEVDRQWSNEARWAQVQHINWICLAFLVCLFFALDWGLALMRWLLELFG